MHKFYNLIEAVEKAFFFVTKTPLSCNVGQEMQFAISLIEKFVARTESKQKKSNEARTTRFSFVIQGFVCLHICTCNVNLLKVFAFQGICFITNFYADK